MEDKIVYISDVGALANEWVVIKRTAYRWVIGVFFILAISSILARAAVRFHFGRRPTVDDYFLYGATVFLVASTALAYDIADDLYFWMALRHDGSLVGLVDPDVFFRSVSTAQARIDAISILQWTTMYLVKASFLAFFKQLIWQVSRIQRYYWAVVTITLMGWMYTICVPFIDCPYLGLAAWKCSQENRTDLFDRNTTAVVVLDALTDIMLVSIPIMLLRRSHFRISQKLALGAFTSLSLVIVCFTIVRVVKINGGHGLDIPWTFFWQQMQATVAVLMGSLTIFRILLTTQESIARADERRRARAAAPRSHVFSWLNVCGRGGRRINATVSSGDLESQDGQGVSKSRSNAPTGLASFFRRKTREDHSGGSRSSSGEVEKTLENEVLAEGDKACVVGEHGELPKTGSD